MAYKIGKNCSTCHYCFNECPVGAIHFKGVEYYIEPDLCIDCGKCAEVCPAGIITDGKEANAATDKVTELTCDAVILGAGGSGLVAAVKLHELTGKKVVVLEKASKVGGNTNLGHAFVVKYSKQHEKAGLKDLREQAIESIYNGADGKDLSKPLLTRATYALGDMFDWLWDFGGADQYFKLVDLSDHPMHVGPFVGASGFFDFPERIENTKSNDHSMGPGWMGTYVVQKMMEQCEKNDIQVLINYEAIHLKMDGNTFKGVEAKTADGVCTIHADCCLMASGGFSHNEEIMRKVRPTFFEGLQVHSFTVASNTGDAITMGEEIGAKMDFEHIKAPLFGPIHHPFNYGVVSLTNSPRIMMVNINGERFKNEGAPPDNDASQFGPLEDQPEKKAYAIFDSATAELMGEELLEHSKMNPGLYRGMVTWKEQLEYECTLDIPAKKAATIEELAKMAGIDPKGLQEQVALYNEACSTGIDSQFGKQKELMTPVKEGPFYAVLLLRFNEGAEGGIVNDDHLRVVKEDGSVCEGLYVAGDCCRGLLKTTDVGGKFGEMPWAMASGYIAAEEMADYLK